MPNKLENIVKDLIKKGSFNTQGALVEALKEQGIVTKQSTVSRVLHRLNAVKRTGPDGAVAYQILNPAFDGGYAHSRGLVHEIGANEAMILLNTRSGSAGHVAQYVDEQGLDEIMGTLAGDNCIFIMPRQVTQINSLVTQLQSLFPTAEKI